MIDKTLWAIKQFTVHYFMLDVANLLQESVLPKTEHHHVGPVPRTK